MEPPPAIGIRFLTIEEPMAILVQDATDAIAKVVEHPFLFTTSFGDCPPFGRFEIGAHRKRSGRLPDGAEVSQQVSGQGISVAHGARIYPGTIESLFQNYELLGFGRHEP